MVAKRFLLRLVVEEKGQLMSLLQESFLINYYYYVMTFITFHSAFLSVAGKIIVNGGEWL